MTYRLSLQAKIFVIAFLNVLLLLGVFAVALRVLFRQDFDSFLLAPAQDRLLSVARLIALELRETELDQRDQLLARYSKEHGASFYLFDNHGPQVAGEKVDLPPSVRFRLTEGPRDVPRPDAPVLPADDSPPFKKRRPTGPPGMFLETTRDPFTYWVGVRVPIPVDDGMPLRGTLILRSNTFLSEAFFDWKPLAAIIGVVLLVELLCWMPLIRGLTKSISRMQHATGRIAEGDFQEHVPDSRGDELGQLGAGINRMAKKLDGHLKGQKRFLGDIAHELSAPIARLQFAASILERRTGEDLRPYVTDVQEEVEHMSGLVGELLSFSKAGISQELKLVPVNLSDAISRVIEREAHGAETDVHVDSKITVMAHPEFLERAAGNLIRNAVRYASYAGPISVLAEEKSGEVSLMVRDCGPGLDEADIEHIFAPFYRPEPSRTRATGGAGLGLAIVKSCVEACQGKVNCRNLMPKGFEVAVKLRAA